MIIISGNFILNFTDFCIIVSFLDKLLTLGILFSTAVRAVLVVANLVILDMLFLISFILALTAALEATLVISGILSSMFFILALYASFLTTSFFNSSLSLLKAKEQALIYQHLLYLLYFSNYLH